MTDLVERLRAALDETERVARAACHGGSGRWSQPDPERQHGRIDDHAGEPVVYDEGVPTAEQAEHIALHDPERELRMVAAHRKILAEHPAREDRAGWDEYRTICATCRYDGGLDVHHYPCPTVAALAEAYGVEA